MTANVSWNDSAVVRRGLFFLFLSLSLPLTANAGKILRLTTFNIEWYGKGTRAPDGERLPEHRDRALRKFIQAELSNSDVIVFQEIVDVSRFKKRVIPRNYRCKTYSKRRSTHQYVVLCHKKDYRFVRAPGERNYELEGVSSGSSKSRPALHGVLVDRKSGEKLIHLFGVHLKAFPDETGKRLSQTKVIAREIRNLDHDLPVAVLGDFNSHISPKTGERYDDKILMDRVFRRYRAGVKRTYLRGQITYRKGEYADQLDHIWVDRSLRYRGKAFVSGACNPFAKASRRIYRDLEYYNENISDHCPLSVSVELDE